MFLHTRFQVRTVGQWERPRAYLEHQGSRSGQANLACRKGDLCEVFTHSLLDGLGGTQPDPLATWPQMITNPDIVLINLERYYKSIFNHFIARYESHILPRGHHPKLWTTGQLRRRCPWGGQPFPYGADLCWRCLEDNGSTHPNTQQMITQCTQQNYQLLGAQILHQKLEREAGQMAKQDLNAMRHFLFTQLASPLFSLPTLRKLGSAAAVVAVVSCLE